MASPKQSPSSKQIDESYKNLAANNQKFISDVLINYCIDRSHVPDHMKQAAVTHSATKPHSLTTVTMRPQLLTEEENSQDVGLFSSDFLKIGKSTEQAFSLRDFDVLETISVGVFGKLQKVRCNRSGVAKGYDMALKTSRITWTLDEFSLNERTMMEAAFWCREGILLLHIKHPHLVTVLGMSYDYCKEHVFIIMEYFHDSRNMEQYIKQEKKVPLWRVRNLLKQLVAGVAHLHSWDIAHRDLKPANLLIRNRSDYLKITDFGSIQRTNARSQTSTHIGSLPYSAPEVFDRNEYQAKRADSHNVGAILLDLLAGLPFALENESRAIELAKGNEGPESVALYKFLELFRLLTHPDLRGIVSPFDKRRGSRELMNDAEDSTSTSEENEEVDQLEEDL